MRHMAIQIFVIDEDTIQKNNNEWIQMLMNNTVHEDAEMLTEHSSSQKVGQETESDHTLYENLSYVRCPNEAWSDGNHSSSLNL